MQEKVTLSEFDNKLVEVFGSTPYPCAGGFHRAILERDYQDWNLETDKRVTWDEICPEQLKKYYDFIYYMDSDGLKYYLPTYLSAIHREQELIDHWVFDSLLGGLKELKKQDLSKGQWTFIHNFLVQILKFCESKKIETSADEYLHKTVGRIEKMLAQN